MIAFEELGLPNKVKAYETSKAIQKSLEKTADIDESYRSLLSHVFAIAFSWRDINQEQLNGGCPQSSNYSAAAAAVHALSILQQVLRKDRDLGERQSAACDCTSAKIGVQTRKAAADPDTAELANPSIEQRCGPVEGSSCRLSSYIPPDLENVQEPSILCCTEKYSRHQGMGSTPLHVSKSGETSSGISSIISEQFVPLIQRRHVSQLIWQATAAADIENLLASISSYIISQGSYEGGNVCLNDSILRSEASDSPSEISTQVATKGTGSHLSSIRKEENRGGHADQIFIRTDQQGVLISPGIICGDCHMSSSACDFGHTTLTADTSTSSYDSLAEAELVLSAALRFCSTAIRSGICHINSLDGSEKASMMNAEIIREALSRMMSAFRRTIHLLINAAINLHLHIQGRSCLTGYLLHKLVSIHLHFQDAPSNGSAHMQECLSFLSPHYATLFQKPRDIDDVAVPRGSEDGRSKPVSAFALCLLAASEGSTAASASTQRRVLLLAAKSATWEDTEVHAIKRSKLNEQGDGRCTHQVNERKAIDLTKALKAWEKNTVRCLGYEGGEFLSQEEWADALIIFFAEEDNIMLDMLVQLQLVGNAISAHDIKLGDALHPLRILHSFLKLVDWDASVLLDFLISAETGHLCLQYLMRSLANSISSWPLLVTICNEPRSQAESSNSTRHALLATSGVETSSLCTTENNEIKFYDEAQDGVKAKLAVHSVGQRSVECLLQLKSTLKRLHKRQLFPYNPSALIRRLLSLETCWREHL